MTPALCQVPMTHTPTRAALADVPTWWAGESLYGLCSRIHALRGGKARITGRLLFGREHACRLIDIPAGLGRFAEATGGLYGPTVNILRQRTVLAAYWPFASDGTRKMVLDAAMDMIGTPIPMALGLPARRLGAHHPLRYCEACHQKALARDGYSTWMIRHQLPGVWWCGDHQRPLAQVPNRRAVWRKPGRDAVPLGTPKSPEEAKALQTMAGLAQAIAGLDNVNEASLAATAVHRLRQLGVATSAARLNGGKMEAWLRTSPLVRWMDQQGDLVDMPTGKWATQLLRHRIHGHPLKWQILWTCAWQTETSEGAVQAFLRAAKSQEPQAATDQGSLWHDSIPAPAKLPLPDNVADAFASHDNMRTVANALGCNLGTVRQWLVDYPALSTTWLARVRADRLRLAVQRVEACMHNHPDISRSELLKRCNTDFNWLAKHAPAMQRTLLDRVPTDRGHQRELF